MPALSFAVIQIINQTFRQIAPAYMPQSEAGITQRSQPLLRSDV